MGGINSNVVLLLHGDGSDAGSVIIDGITGRTTTRVNTPTTVSAIKKFGQGAIRFSNLDGISHVASFNLQIADFGMDWWVGFSVLPTTTVSWQIVAGQGSTYNTSNRWYFWYLMASASMQLHLYANNPTGGSLIVGWPVGVFSENVFKHLAVQRSSGTMKCFCNGTSVTMLSLTGDQSLLFSVSAQFFMGTFSGNANYLRAVHDEFRIVRGVAVWTENFTPPTEPYTYDLPTSEIDLTASVNSPRIITSTAFEYANKFRSDVVRKGIDLSADVIRGCLMSAGFAFDRDAHHYWDNISGYEVAFPSIETSHYSKTVLLLHCDGTENDSIITDEITGSATIAGGGSVTSINAFNAQGFRVSGDTAGTYLTSRNLTLGASAFTIDYRWGYSDVPATGSTRTYFIFDKFASGILGRLTVVHTWASTSFITYLFWCSTAGALTWYMRASIAATISANTVHHAAWVRNATSLFFFWNGVSCGIVTSGSVTTHNYSLGAASLPIYIGQRGSFTGTGGTSLNHTVDEIRIVVGSAVWEANFTPPSYPYSSMSLVGNNLLTPTITENDTSDVISIALSGMSWTVSVVQSIAGILLYDETTSNVIGYLSYPTTMPAGMPLVVTGVGIKVS